MPTDLSPADDLAACCAPVTAGVLDEAGAERLARVLKALAEPTRLRLVSLVAAQPGAEACICDLTAPVGLSQPTVSHHMKVLTDAGLTERQQRGRWAYYRLVPGALDALARLLTHQADLPATGQPATGRDPLAVRSVPPVGFGPTL